MQDLRQSKENYYLDIAETVAHRATCLRKKYGAIIVKNDSILATGYNGAPRGRQNCCDLNFCQREKLGIPRGERYELCRSVHAEMNAIIAASRENMLGSTLYLVGLDTNTGELVSDACCCTMCKRTVINAGISSVVIRNTPTEFTVINVREWIFNDDSLSGTFGY
ncbi:MAG: cytidine deaminase [Clostridia bacterium]|nr:cytidine deaminase [Clostridia bacterium]